MNVINLVYLPLLTILSVVSVYQVARLYMAPGIEPGNLIRSTLIRSPPGAGFFAKTKVTGRITKRSSWCFDGLASDSRLWSIPIHSHLVLPLLGLILYWYTVGYLLEKI